jgi:hypothetical protein
MVIHYYQISVGNAKDSIAPNIGTWLKDQARISACFMTDFIFLAYFLRASSFLLLENQVTHNCQETVSVLPS